VSAADRRQLARSFDSVADEYDRGRPSWPRDAVDWLLGTDPIDVLDVGAGTGKLTTVLVEAGHRVTAVEPSAQMRGHLERRLRDIPIVAANAEQLPLPDDSFDAVVVAAAFHWFEADQALAQFARVLRPGGVVGLLGNVFDVSVPWVAALRDVLGPPAAERRDFWPDISTLSGRFARVDERSFPHRQELTRPQLIDLAGSRSAFAVMDEATRSRELARVEQVWEQAEAADGTLDLPWIARARRCLAPLEGWSVERVAAREVLPLRAAVLRPGLPESSARFEGDESPEAIHLAIRQEERTVAVASAIPDGLPGDPRPGDWRVRGMASVPELRGRGMGAALLSAIESRTRAVGARRLWCNARVGAVGLYERAGYGPVGARFELAGIGEHARMVHPLD